MTPADERLAALAAVFAPERAGRLLALAACAGAADLSERLAAATRRARLSALAASLAATSPREEDLLRALAAERPRLRALLGAGPTGGPPSPAPHWLTRLAAERAAAVP